MQCELFFYWNSNHTTRRPTEPIPEPGSSDSPIQLSTECSIKYTTTANCLDQLKFRQPFNTILHILYLGFDRCRCTPRVCIYFLICSSYDNLSLKIASPNRTHELGHRLGQSMTCMQVHWRMGEEERAGLGRVGKVLEEDHRYIQNTR